MIRGGRIFLAGGCLAAAGCVATHNVQVRALADPAAKFRYSGGLLAQARGQLALGNVGLALETFRKLQREQPPGADSFAGIAACYSAMGRHDLARANYEYALAYAPNDPALLFALASSLERLGEGEQATQVRAEAARLRTAPTGQPKIEQTAVAPLGVPRAASVTVKLPQLATVSRVEQQESVEIAPPQTAAATVNLPPARPAVLKSPALAANVAVWMPPASESQFRPAAASPETTIAIAPPQLNSARVNLSATHPISLGGTALHADLDISIAAATVTPFKAADASMDPNMVIARPQLTAAAVDLPAAHPAVLKQAALDAKVEVSPAPTNEVPSSPAPAPIRKPMAPVEAVPTANIAQNDVRVERGPYLERKSRGEVSLITTSRHVATAELEPRILQAQALARAAQAAAERRDAMAQPAAPPLLATAVRWVPLRYASAPQNVVLLNAARSEGLAARTRSAFLDRGWRKIGIGNARAVRQRSLVLYSPARAFIARRIAAHLRCKAVKSWSVKNVIVLLGRDTASRRSPSSRA